MRFFGTYQWWRIPVLSGLLGWKDCSGFASKIRNFACKKKGWMETLTNKAEWFKNLLSIFDLVSCFFLYQILVLAYKAPSLRVPNLVTKL